VPPFFVPIFYAQFSSLSPLPALYRLLPIGYTPTGYSLLLCQAPSCQNKFATSRLSLFLSDACRWSFLSVKFADNFAASAHTNSMSVQLERNATPVSASPESTAFKSTRLSASGDLSRKLTEHGYSGSVLNQAEDPRQARPRAEGGDFIHSQTQKMTITLLSSTNIAQKPLRFFAFFCDFCAQNGRFDPKLPLSVPKHPLHWLLRALMQLASVMTLTHRYNSIRIS
jgi:hypothetical protein